MNTLKNIQEKILPGNKLNETIESLKKANKSIVFTNGCFDILHKGHITYLSEAADLGDIMVIGLNSDDSVRRIKGTNRPVQDQDARAMALASLFFVNFVVLFEEDTPYELIRTVQPDTLVKGGDYDPAEIAGYDLVTESGGRVLTIPLVKGVSTTSIIERLSANDRSD
ncbi:MAG: D-glycero-beta-D-manno-heptose 1-phosphate adenylyltransferase [Bacteroidales bacterium]|nr:D-glycero-beta-D-manno-heptose 1-phosphate adenylyltransferase [Bacteroidales bacterium]